MPSGAAIYRALTVSDNYSLSLLAVSPQRSSAVCSVDYVKATNEPTGQLSHITVTLYHQATKICTLDPSMEMSVHNVRYYQSVVILRLIAR
jgi:hypothetical protein